MKKQSKRRSFVKKICKYFFFQILLILLLFGLLNKTEQYTIEDLRQETIIVRDVEYHNTGGGKHRRIHRYLMLYTDDNAYQYDLSFSDESCGYSVEDLKQKLRSAPLNILVKERLLYCDSIVDVHNEQDIFYSLNDYNKEMQGDRIGVWIIFGILELIFLAFSGFMIYLEYSTMFSRYKKEKKRKKNQPSKTV
ncbi:MAG: hypothetical protein J6Q82_05750 [Clostridia bacterium]|nr:hypothetical protein [Clostridia bacterium]